MDCKSKNESHIASITNQKTDDFIARKIRRGEAMWIGANRQTLETEKGKWAWADGCSPWDYTSWANFYDPDWVLDHECAFYLINFENLTSWRAGKCDDQIKQLRYVWCKSICPDGNSSTRNSKSNMPAFDLSTIAVGSGILVGLLLLIALAVLTFKKLRKRSTKPEQRSTDENFLYGQYYKVDGERIDQGRLYAEDRNPNYYS